jgi:hypothetical protein
MFAADIFAMEQIAVHGRKMKLSLVSFGKYIVHALYASYGIVLLGFFIEVMLPNSRKLDYLFFNPTFLFPIIAGLGMGIRFGSKLPALLSRCLFLLPFAMLLWELWAFVSSNYDVTWQNFYNTYLGTHCESSECLGGLLVTSPLVSSLAYTVGAEIGRLGRIFSSKHHSLKKVA